MAPPLHPDLEPLAFLLGTWTGRGHGVYPTIEPFDYEETVTFAHTGRPFLVYTQRTVHASDRRPLHAETGFFRVPAGRRVELVIAHPNGLVEISEGTVEGPVLRARSTLVGRTSTAKEVSAVHRELTLDAAGVLHYELGMAAVGRPLERHLTAQLRRAAGA